MKRIILLFLNLCVIALTAQSVPYSSAEFYDDLLRLKNNATVMYVAAHPDDENTRVISWLTQEKHLDAVYLSLTRGDGGQNLIGIETGEALGLLRTQELLEARKIDKGRQLFTRAVDFGYSKNTEDTFAHWNRNALLADMVWAIRVNQPDIIITRFHPESNGQTHGHHTASAQLAMQAFDLAANPAAFPEQLDKVSTWQVKRIFFNTSWFFYGSQEAFDKVDKSQMYALDLGTYFSHLGISNNEIASLSRSKHASQGFGTSLSRGSSTEWLEFLKGDKPKGNDIFEGINLQWENSKIQNLIDKIIAEFDFTNPEKSSANLVELYALIDDEKYPHQKEKVKELILKSKGIYIEWTTPEKFGVNGQTIATKLEIANRSTSDLTFTVDGKPLSVKQNTSEILNAEETIKNAINQTPYWLEKPIENDLFVTDNSNLLGLPKARNPLTKHLQLELDGNSLNLEIPLQQKNVDPSVGEIYHPFYVVPPLSAKLDQKNYIFRDKSKKINVEVTSYLPSASGKILLKTDSSWNISDEQFFSFTSKEEKQIFTFDVIPPTDFGSAELIAEIHFNDKVYTNSLQVMEYPHIERQIYKNKSSAELKHIEIKVPDVKVAYIQGSGDEVPGALTQMGLQVDEVDIKNWNPNSLKDYNVLILGIRAFNTQPQLESIQQDLWNFVASGGTVIVQYNTIRELEQKPIAPFHLKLGRDRIAEENANLKILQPEHEVFNFPNKITAADFDHWQQERGLYFADEWDKNLMPLLEGNDNGESPKKGILLVGNYGKGHFVYTGLSFFRQLPAGVPGAYRLLMNLLALGEN